MRTIAPVFAILGGAALGLALGFCLRSFQVRGPSAGPLLHVAQAGSSALVTNTESAQRSLRPAPADDSPLAVRLARDLSMTSGVTNWLCWWQALDQAMPSDFPRLLRLAKGNRLITRMIAERWAERSPENFFQTAVQAARAGNPLSGEVTDYLFNQWAKRDPSSLVAALKQVDDFPGRANWRRDVATTIFGNNPELGLQLLSEWHIENFGPDMKAVHTWAAANPRHAAEFALGYPAGYASTAAMQAIGQEWAKTAPAEALAFAVAQPGNLGSAMADSVLQTWASRDLNAASEWLSSADPSVQKKLCPQFVEAWAKQDASDALAWCQSNLSGSSLIQSVNSLFKGAAAKDAQAAAQLVSGMDPSPARAHAAAVVAAQWFPSFGSTAKSVSPETLAWLNGLDPDSIARAVSEVQWQWANSDPASMAAFLQSTNAGEVASFPFSNLAQDMARKDPASALDWASQLPDGRAMTAGSAAFSQWGQAQPDLAMQWWNALPADDARRQPFLQSLLSQLAWDPQASSRFAQVAANDPAAARKALTTMNLDDQRRNTLLNLLSQR